MISKTFVVILCVLFMNFFFSNGKIVDTSNNGSYTAREWNSSGISHKHFTPYNKEEFPKDVFTEEQLKHGAVFLHFLGALYSFGIIGIVCGDYFLPSIDCICSDLNLSQDVAAATFMSFATTAPELFIILIATFITESDIGVGAVVGSGMFNILGVATIGGLAAITPIKLDWWPLYRDSLVYVVTPIALAVIVADGEVTLMESLCLIIYYLFYFIIMFFNRNIRREIKVYIKEFKNERRLKKAGKDSTTEKQSTNVPTISLTCDENKNGGEVQTTAFNSQGKSKDADEEDVEYEGSFKAYFINYEDSRSLRRISACSACSSKSNVSRRKSDRSLNLGKSNNQSGSPNHLQIIENVNYIIPQIPDTLEGKSFEDTAKKINGEAHICDGNETEELVRPNLLSLPEGGFWDKAVWVIQWPATVALYFTIPDCRFEKWRKFYPATFIMCVFWIGLSSYFGTWMISVMGETFQISDSVMGLTFLALGGSMPEAISTFIMARQGEGGLGFSNGLGGNTMDICLCLGLPWMAKCLIRGPVQIESEGIQYNTAALVVGIVVLLAVVTHTKFHMNKKLGLICCTFYLIFIVISVLIELNIIRVDVER